MSVKSYFFLAILALAACAPRGEIRIAPEAAGVGSIERVYVGSTRGTGAEGEQWSTERSFTPRYARFDISIPPEREVGSLHWPRKDGPTNPRTDFLTTDAQIYRDSTNFRSALAAEFRGNKKGTRDAVVFVHGFNNTFAEGLYRFAQLYHDLSLPGVPVHYSWPSRGSVVSYAYDRDSALFARDGLEDLLTQISAAGAERILIVAHSMGSLLTMETLRQVQIQSDPGVRRKLGGVVLMSPDIDVDVFRAQARRIGTLPQPFVVMTSQKDYALAVSARISGEAERLGNIRDAKVLEGLNVTLLEVGAFSSGDGHFTAGTSPALISILSRATDINQALGSDARARIGLLPGAVLTFQGVTQVVLSPVIR